MANARRDTEIRHEACDTRASGAERLDANGDGRVDVTIVRAGAREICRAVDLNFDGVVDTWVYRDEQGKLRRRENDYNRDGRIDEITLYRAGVLIEKQRSTSLGDKLDTWQFFESGVLSRTERDSDGDEMVDQWWEYPQAGCPVIHSDLDGDGRPDPGATMDYCKETGYVPPQRQDPERAASPDFSRPGSLPTELDNKPQGEGDSTESKPQGDKP